MFGDRPRETIHNQIQFHLRDVNIIAKGASRFDSTSRVRCHGLVDGYEMVTVSRKLVVTQI
jgi:hypothetical protein